MRHNRVAPWWAALFVLCLGTGLSSLLFKSNFFLNSYGLDVTGPAWSYILFRGLAYQYTETFWTRFFTPVKTFGIFVFFTFAVESAQYFELYESTFDPWDFIAYLTLLGPMFLIDWFCHRLR